MELLRLRRASLALGAAGVAAARPPAARARAAAAGAAPRCASTAPALASVSATRGACVVRFADGSVSRLHAAWLRDHCLCAACRHPLTRQRTANTAALLAHDQAHTITDARVTAAGALQVTWGAQPRWFAHGAASHAGAPAHTSIFPPDFLAAHAYWTEPGEALPPVPAACADPVADTRGRVLWRAAHFGAPWPPSPPDARGQPTCFGDMAALPQLPLSELVPGGGGSGSSGSGGDGSSSGASPLGALAAMARLRDYGFCVVTGVPPTLEGTEAACRAVAPPMPTLYSRSGMWCTELRAAEEAAVAPPAGAQAPAAAEAAATSTETDFNDTAFSTLPLPEHTDGTYFESPPGLQAFHALRADERGGHSLLVDGFAVAQVLRARHAATFDFFAATELRFHHTDAHAHNQQWRRVIGLGADGDFVSFSWNNDDRAPLVPRRTAGGGGERAHDADAAALVHEFYTHLPVLLAALQDPAHQLWLPLRPGSLLLFDNTRVLHGRSAIDPRSGRVLAGCYIAQQDWHGRMRALAAQHQGYEPAL